MPSSPTGAESRHTHMVKALAMSSCISNNRGPKAYVAADITASLAKCANLPKSSLAPAHLPANGMTTATVAPLQDGQHHGMKQQAACVHETAGSMYGATANTSLPVQSHAAVLLHSWRRMHRTKFANRMLRTGTSMQDRSSCSIKCHLDTITTWCSALRSHCKQCMLR